MKTQGLVALALVVTLAGCGGSKRATSVTPPPPTTTPTMTNGPAGSGAGALQAEAQSAATGDIPDNQAFLVFSDPPAGYSMRYPEGWAQSGNGPRVVIRDKNNIIRVLVRKGALPTSAAVRSEIASVAGARLIGVPQPHRLPGGPSIKVVYSTQSAPNPVTGKRVTLVVDRYYLSRAGKEAVVDLGTPRGVDNVDAYRLISESFRWR
jgi:hypothetical protein